MTEQASTGPGPHYAAVEHLRDGQALSIRALRPGDREGLLAAFAGLGERSRTLRFFAPRRGFSEREVDYFVNVDFREHVALVAEAGGAPTLVGGGRFIVTAPGTAELAFAVADAWQGRGVGAALMRHLIALARRSGLSELTAEVLSDNAPMLALFRRCGTPVEMRREGRTVHVVLRLR
ncbi:GCN5-related N-acetyltransferase [Methylobacterium sp. 4-46]|uniref:GNAT family N-acetyltransferase n=1 Tax=unclassified Methylobacterium TaxID=2615210 RepID=UPI000152CFC4|nr:MULTISPECIES: GNAT family N-acetyltransferase [Methylobacterium]ACA16071.1 GCN5-related N-acetyltransferase [Methylobacterium sp. 4-46]WFT81783.1 GNAT family N-acetyltransferase [Methylobacterium nodulans]